jgi:PHP family Zn ribbon phosphoesterase
MKNVTVRNSSGDDWKTPEWFYKKLDSVYHFDFDPCPYQADFDGLKVTWGGVNFINPPYSRKLKEAFIRKALEESKKGKTCVLLLPVSTSTAIFHDVILPNAKKIEFVRGRLKFEQKDKDGTFKAKGCGQHDSMIVVF